MIGWMAYWIWWIVWRSAITLACMFTIQNVIHQEGYYIESRTLFVATVCAILGIRVWMPSAKRVKHDTQHS